MNGFIKAKQEGRTLIIGHRGCTAVRPENTMAAFRYALESGADGLETDLHATKDGYIVLMHDAHLSRCTDGEGLIKDLTLEEIRAFSAGVKFSEEYRDEKVPLFEELIELVRDREDVLLNLEFKDYPEELGGIAYETAAKIMEMTEAAGLKDRVLLNTFSGSLARWLNKNYPDYPIHTFWPEGCMRSPGQDIYEFSDWVCSWTGDGLYRLHDMGCGVCTCESKDSEERMRMWLDRGIRMFTCNEPKSAVQMLKNVTERMKPMSFVIDAFRKYIRIPSASNAESTSKPTTPEQLTLAAVLAEDMRKMGISEVHSDELGYAYGCVPANCEGQPSIGLIAHLDVVDDAPCTPMNDRLIENYDGGVIKLNDTVSIDPEEYDCLKRCKGMDLIVTDGTTILGADDKAGVAIILAAAKKLLEDDGIKHGDVKICFTPDEEVGGGADDLDIPAFGADFAYTVDGGGMGEIEYENFNAASAKIDFNGVLIHPGSAKNRMKNASLMACEFAGLLPGNETPAHTEDREGFYHLGSIEGDVSHATLKYILRDHDMGKLEQKKAYINACAALINAKYGEGSCEVEIADSYRNMADVLRDRMDIVERARDAYRALGEETVSPAVRGGTDGARLSWRGLPCPNLSTGGMNGHSVRECACVQDMEKMVDVLIEIVRAR